MDKAQAKRDSITDKIGETRTQLLSECNLMVRSITQDGQGVSPFVSAKLAEVCDGKQISFPDLTQMHAELCGHIAPRTPRALEYLETGVATTGPLRLLGPLPVIRQLVIGVLFFVAATFLLISRKDVDGNLNWVDASGNAVLWQGAFMLSAAGLGATFSGLYKATTYVRRQSFDPRYATAYRTEVILGLASGMILTIFLAHQFGAKEIQALPAATMATIAFVGGYSSSLVASVLHAIVSTVESRVKVKSVSVNTEVKAQVKALQAQVEAQAKVGLLPAARKEVPVKVQAPVAPVTATIKELPKAAESKTA